jgi:hypothetical protein
MAAHNKQSGFAFPGDAHCLPISVAKPADLSRMLEIQKAAQNAQSSTFSPRAVHSLPRGSNFKIELEGLELALPSTSRFVKHLRPTSKDGERIRVHSVEAIRWRGDEQGSSVMHPVDVKLVPEKKAIYDVFSDNDGAEQLAKCSVKAYVWNAGAKAFDWNAQLTKRAARSYCRSSQELLPEQR